MLGEFSNSDYLALIAKRRKIIIRDNQEAERAKWAAYWKEKARTMEERRYNMAGEVKQKQMRAVMGSRKLGEFV